MLPKAVTEASACVTDIAGATRKRNAIHEALLVIHITVSVLHPTPLLKLYNRTTPF